MTATVTVLQYAFHSGKKLPDRIFLFPFELHVHVAFSYREIGLYSFPFHLFLLLWGEGGGELPGASV